LKKALLRAAVRQRHPGRSRKSKAYSLLRKSIIVGPGLIFL
jgi:hypothetical protein